MKTFDLHNLIKDGVFQDTLRICAIGTKDKELDNKLRELERSIQSVIQYCEDYEKQLSPGDNLRHFFETTRLDRSGEKFIEYRLGGMLHRTDGPARISASNSYRSRRDLAEGSWYLFGTTTEYSIVRRALIDCKISESHPCFDRRQTIALAIYMVQNFGGRKVGKNYLRRDRIIDFLHTIGETSLSQSLLAGSVLSQ